MAVVGMVANPSGTHQVGRSRAGPMLPGTPEETRRGRMAGRRAAS
jgi:hypothetical protein